MKGLFWKDFALLKNQMRQMVLFILIAAFMTVFDEDATFQIGYCIMMFGILGLSTISYDEFDNGSAFLFTLPITRKQYVLEKMLFLLTMLLAGGAVAFTILILNTVITGQNLTILANIEFMMATWATLVIMLSCILPVELKYGAEKGRVAMVAVFAVFFAAGLLVKKLLGPTKLKLVVVFLENMTREMLWGSIIVVGVTIIFISYTISCRIMEKKEF